MKMQQRLDGTEQNSPATPPLSVLLAYAAMVPPIFGALLGWLAPKFDLAIIEQWETLYCGALLAFFAGVRRGLSFRQAGGPAFAQIAGMIWLFGLSVVSLVTAALPAAMLFPIIGFLSLIPLDVRASATFQAPLYFGRLRWVQMWLPVISLTALLIRAFAP